MSYTPTEWKNGDTITAEKLNKIEEGIEGASGVLIVTEIIDVERQVVLNKTWQEIYDAVFSGKQVFMQNSSDGIELIPLSKIYYLDSSSQYGVGFSNTNQYDTSSANSYPRYNGIE